MRDAAQSLRRHPCRQGSCITLPPRGRLLATGDLHDNPRHFAAVQSLAHLDHSPDHHVTLHELIHGDSLINNLDLSYRMLCKVAHWILQFPAQIHPLLANHEMCQMTGRGVSKGAGDSVKLFNDGLDYVFGDDSETVAEAIGEFMRSMPLALRTEDGVFCAHALPSPPTLRLFNPDTIYRDLTDEDFVPPRGSAYLMVWGRGWTHEVTDPLAAAWRVKTFILGHQYVESGVELVGDRIVVLNTDHDRGMVIAIDLASPPTAVAAVASALPIRSYIPLSEHAT
jgi:hypothetical protein